MEFQRRGEIKEQMRDFNDHELLRIVALEESEFLPEAMEIAREELELRGIKPLDAKGYYAQFPTEDPAFGFCERCLDQTTSEEPGYWSYRTVIGPRLLDSDHKCEKCGSMLMTKWYCIIFPVRRMEQYRVLDKKGSALFESEIYRRVKEPERPDT